MPRHNAIDSKILKANLMAETCTRKTISLYRYFMLADPEEFRHQLYHAWTDLNIFGRVYIAHEGINAQMSIPEDNFGAFMKSLEQHPVFENIPIKYAIEDNGKSFYKLTIKTRPKLVADGLDDETFDVTNVGNHLSAAEFHRLAESNEHTIVDMRNRYESEIGHFKGALCPDVDTFREELVVITELLKEQKDKKLLLYCTGGIRCEKASAYLKHHGFKDVNQLHGGILEYTRSIRQLGLEPLFTGKNFVFDQRMGESVDGKIISRCHQCGKPWDVHSNCANDSCHLLLLQCTECAEMYKNCCSAACREMLTPEAPDQTHSALRHKSGKDGLYRKSFRPAKCTNFADPDIVKRKKAEV